MDRPPRSVSGLIPVASESPCRHGQYLLKVSDMIMARMCQRCGKTWVILRDAGRGTLTATWMEIDEPEVFE